MDMKNGIFIILGSNIGTSTTALINTIGKNINAKRTGIIHLSFKFLGLLYLLLLLGFLMMKLLIYWKKWIKSLRCN